MTPSPIIWIDSTCIGCGSCPDACPSVFTMPESMALVLGTARCDQVTDSNEVARSRLVETLLDQLPAIEEAIAGCPVEAIHRSSGAASAADAPPGQLSGR